eukprot:1449753-Prymnesium_polylepis.1
MAFMLALVVVIVRAFYVRRSPSFWSPKQRFPPSSIDTSRQSHEGSDSTRFTTHTQVSDPIGSARARLQPLCPSPARPRTPARLPTACPRLSDILELVST